VQYKRNGTYRLRLKAHKVWSNEENQSQTLIIAMYSALLQEDPL